MSTHIGTSNPRRLGRGWLVLAAIVAACVVVPVVWLVIPWPFRGEPTPDPNGYETLVAAARKITGEAPSVPQGKGIVTKPLAETTDEELRAFVGPNTEAVALAKVGLGQSTCVPLSIGTSIEGVMADFGRLRRLGRLLACDAALAEREGRTAEAVEGYLGLFRLARATSFGGLLFNRLAEPAIAWSGVEGLNRLAPALPAAEARRLAAKIERFDRAREPLNRVVDRDLSFSLARGGWRLRVAYAVNFRTFQGLLKPAVASARQSDQRGSSLLRLLAVKLALRAYSLDHPDAPLPASLDSLAPGYLQAVPDDPFGKGPLKFKVQGGSVRVYSLGADGRDDDGAPPASKYESGGDLMLETKL
jgi:hypothetical protein